MGILMASMSLGRTIAPFTCGVMFESELWLSQDYNLTQTDGWFGREARDPACYASNATELAALGCTVPDYVPEFQTVFSLSPYLLGTLCSALAVLAVLVMVPLKTGQAAGGPPGKPPAGEQKPVAKPAPEPEPEAEAEAEAEEVAPQAQP